MYANGTGVPQDDEAAVMWWRLAVTQGAARAQNGLGLMYANGRGGVLQDDREAVRWYRLSAEQGYFRGQTSLGRLYATGRGVQQDDAEAVRWYRRRGGTGRRHGTSRPWCHVPGWPRRVAG